nr:methyltransferase domain-containing protein [uncultured Rhodopila sp.]
MSRLSLALDNTDLAEHYEQISAERQFKVGSQLAAALEIAPGEHVLDVGSGTGLLAGHVFDLVGPAGSVTGIDPLPLRIEIAKQRRNPAIRFEVGNAYDLSRFADASFDVVLLNAVFHWLPEKLEPLRQFARVLAPGGRLGIATGSREHRNVLHTVKARVLARAPFDRYPEGQDGVAHHISVEELDALLKQAGFVTKTIDVVANPHHFADGDAAVRFWEASSFGNSIGHLPVSIRAAARKAIADELDALRTADGIALGGARIVALATKPGTAARGVPRAG